MAQQTAVEYAINEIFLQIRRNPIVVTELFLWRIEDEAKAMEKEQIINAWRNGDNDSMYEPKQLDESAEQYYNETYNK